MLPFFRKEVEVRGVVVQVIRNINTEEKRSLKKRQNMDLEPLIYSPGSEEYE